MASGCKTGKAELVAIYRLEFYRKQKNWKFCRKEKAKQPEECSSHSPNPEQKCLNKTYHVDAKDEKSLLNQAFLEANAEEDITPHTDPPKKPKASRRQNKAFKNRNVPSGTDTVDTPKPLSVPCDNVQTFQNTKEPNTSDENPQPQKLPKVIYQDLPNNFETGTVTADNAVGTNLEEEGSQNVATKEVEYINYANEELDTSSRCTKRKHPIWTHKMPEDVEEALEDNNYYYEVQVEKVLDMEQPLWFQEFTKDAQNWQNSDLNDVQTWPEAAPNTESNFQKYQDLNNIDNKAQTGWVDQEAGDSLACGWQQWVIEPDGTARYINNWQQTQQNFVNIHQPIPEAQDYVNKYKTQDLQFVERQDVCQNDEIPRFGNVHNTQYFGDVSTNLSEGQRAKQYPLVSPQSWPCGEPPRAMDLASLEPGGCVGCGPQRPEPQGGQKADTVWSEDVLRELEVLESGAGAPAAASGRWVPPDRLLEWLLTKEPAPCAAAGAGALELSSGSAASEDEFVRGAHCNPHSTEIELSVEACEQTLPPRRQPLSALVSCGVAHARALHALATEMRAREDILREKELRSRALTSYPHHPHNSQETSSEEFPTRDIGLLAAPSDFLAGSHRNHAANSALDVGVFGENGVVISNNGATCNQVNFLYNKITSPFKTNLDCNEVGFNGLTDIGNQFGMFKVTPAVTGVDCNELGTGYNENVYGNLNNDKWTYKVKEMNNNEIQCDLNQKNTLAEPGAGLYEKRFGDSTVGRLNGLTNHQRMCSVNSNEKWGKFNEAGVQFNNRGVNVIDVNQMEHSVGRGRGRLSIENSIGIGRGRGRI